MKSHDGDLPIHLANVGNEQVVRILYPHTTELGKNNISVEDIISNGKIYDGKQKW